MEPIQKRTRIIEYLAQPVNYTVCDTKFISTSAKFVVLGYGANGSGRLEIYELDNCQAKKIKEIDKSVALKCGTMNACSSRNRQLAVGDFEGRLQVIDLEQPEMAVYNVMAHSGIINTIDGMGGRELDCGPAEILTGSHDGSVKVWDIRQKDAPVVNISQSSEEVDLAFNKETSTGERSCWAVAFGDGFSNSDRTVAAGFDNGDLKLFDLRAMKVRWETRVKHGICGIEFDHRAIPMNKMTVVTLEDGLLVYDMRTQHATHGFSCLEAKNSGKEESTEEPTTVWSVRHLPQNRDLFSTSDGNGTIRLWNYKYPHQRREKADDGGMIGAMGQLHMLDSMTVSTQPVYCMDWHPDKLGLAVCGDYDQTVRVLIATNLNSYN